MIRKTMEDPHSLLPEAMRSHWEPRFRALLAGQTDAAHEIGHFERVALWALRLAEIEGADPVVVWVASWLHDMVHVPKNSPDRSRASTLSAEAASLFLGTGGWTATPVEAIAHAIAAHSFSARIEPETIEAAVVQDADRLEALGAIGLSRCLMLGGQMGSRLFHPEDPWGERRALTDDRIAVDHFFAKLLGLPRTMRTEAGRVEALRRVELLRTFLLELARETGFHDPSFD